MLLSVEPAPFPAADFRRPRAEDPIRPWVAVRDEQPGDLVVAVVLPEPTGRRVDRRRRVATLREPADRPVLRVRVVGADVERVAGVERVPLAVQGVTGILNDTELVARQEVDVVEAAGGLRALEEDGDLPRIRRGARLHDLEHASPAAGSVVLDARRIRVAGLREVELAEACPRAENAVLGPLERRPVLRLGREVRVEWGVPVDRSVVHRHPAGRKHVPVAVERDLVGPVDRGLRCDGDRRSGRVQDLERLQLAVCEIAAVRGNVAVDEAVRDLGGRRRLVRTADVLDEPDVPVAVVLDAFVAPAPERARDVGDRRGETNGRRVRRRVLILGGEEQPLRERVPGGAVDRGDRRARRVLRREQCYAVVAVGIQVDAREVALLPAGDGSAVLVTLEEEVRSVVVVRIRPGLVLEDEIRVLVRLGLLRLGLGGPRRRHQRHVRVPAALDVVLVAVVRDDPLWVLELHRALRDGDLREAGRETRRR